MTLESMVEVIFLKIWSASKLNSSLNVFNERVNIWLNECQCFLITMEVDDNIYKTHWSQRPRPNTLQSVLWLLTQTPFTSF